MGPTLVVLAAGLGSRFGGNKQVAAIGPGGRPLLAYGIHDAARAGFARAVVVTRAELEPSLRTILSGADLPLEFTFQATRPGRPWGTGHALLAAKGVVHEPFMVVNADDFYGAGTYRVLAEFLTSAAGVDSVAAGALATFPLGVTLSADGPVNRGVCRTEDGTWLAGIEEVRGVVAGQREWPGDTPVSLNCWGFTPAIFPLVQQRFTAYLGAAPGEPDGEFMLPRAVNDLMDLGQLRVRLLQATGPWIGLTWPGDAPRAAADLARMTAAGDYPATW
ncbi:MAG: NTP transferase domain-containing protein [Actinomycetota bacterium]|nr:NTP transferase domain-containing protein [Actinomycetota bacterium]